MGLTLLLGGARAGKSSLAVRLASASSRPVAVIATAEARDEEMRARIARHRATRPSEWSTIEEPIDLEGALAGIPPESIAIVDCLTLWIANAMEIGWSDQDMAERSRRASKLAADGRTIAVSNEVGWGIVPTAASVRRYRDLLGTVNAMWAEVADRTWLVVAGKALPLSGPPELEP
jgi:adenosyl cobinamide kinase/adenosyl cobinamide phosphate guanylyltransferase